MNLSTLLFEKKEKKEVVEPVHDLDWAKNVLQTRDNGTLQHYKDYYEALEILYKSGQPYYFMGWRLTILLAFFMLYWN